ncbi:hypothetical protein [Micromonospora coxensis]|uniref:hypothetical protein n=1 Tax=Micromonospora coxensis TaxID=356852 RepID=UPI00341A14D5
MADGEAAARAGRGLTPGAVLGFASHALPMALVWLLSVLVREHDRRVDLEAGGRFGAALGIAALFVAAHLLVGLAVFVAEARGSGRSGLVRGWTVGWLLTAVAVVWFCA